MHINEQYHDLPLLETQTYQFIGREGEILTKEEQVLNEHLIDVYLNDQLTMKLICLPQNLTELVLGRLLTEHIIQSIDDVEQIYICEYGKRAKVYLKQSQATDAKKNTSFVETTPTCCTGNHILNDYFSSDYPPLPVTPIEWKPEWIFHMADTFADGMPLHGVTFATHSCLLARRDEILFSCEDIGRHNALDKVIGYALRHQIAIGNSVDVKKYVSSVTSFDFVVASPNTFSNVQGFRFKDDSVSNEIISDIENNIPVLNGSRIYKNTLDDVSVTYDYGSLVTEVLDEYTEDNHLIRSGMVNGRTYPVKLGVDYRPLCNIYGVEKSILPKLNFIEGETDIQQLTSYLESGNYVIEISAINPNESPEFLCPLNQEVTIYKDGLPYKTVSVIARAVVDFSLVESPGKNVGYTDVGGDCPIFYMSNEMFVELYNNPAIMSYVFDVEKEHFLPATEYINSLPTVEYASSETLAQTMNGLKQTIFIIGGLIGFLLGSIGLVNFSNIIITGIINRQREFATLESIGMTKKQINKLTVLEGLFYAFLICVMGLPLSLIVANTILPTFFNQPDLWLFTIQPTIFPLILEGIVICVVAIIVPHVSFRYFRKTSIVARLRVVE